jgi:SAM-dependent methyltransferase
VTVLGSLPRPTAVTRLRAVAVRLLEERYLGVHTGVQIRPQDLGYRQGLYLASSWLVLRELFRNMEVAEDDVFVDIGSGMGRVVFMAARRPFKRVIGVERSLRLNEVARGIVDRKRRLLACQDVALLTVDALEWDVPDDVTVVYLFCPFPDTVFQRLVDRLIASIDHAPRHLRVVYNFSTVQDRAILEATGRAQRISFRVPWYLRSRFAEVSMYRLLPRVWEPSRQP